MSLEQCGYKTIPSFWNAPFLGDMFVFGGVICLLLTVFLENLSKINGYTGIIGVYILAIVFLRETHV